MWSDPDVGSQYALRSIAIHEKIKVVRKRPADSPLFRHRPQRQQLIKATFWPRG